MSERPHSERTKPAGPGNTAPQSSHEHTRIGVFETSAGTDGQVYSQNEPESYWRNDASSAHNTRPLSLTASKAKGATRMSAGEIEPDAIEVEPAEAEFNDAALDAIAALLVDAVLSSEAAA